MPLISAIGGGEGLADCSRAGFGEFGWQLEAVAGARLGGRAPREPSGSVTDLFDMGLLGPFTLSSSHLLQKCLRSKS